MAWFDATTVDPSAGTGNLPVGRHPVVIKSAAVTPTKGNDGGLLLLTVEIIDGQYKGVQGAYRLNLWNASPQSAEIASKQLSALCHVTNRFQLNAEPKGVELFGIPFFIIVEQQAPPNEKYTQIVGVQDINGNAPVKGQGPSQGQPQQQPPMQQQPMQQPPQGQPAWGAPQQPQQQPPAQPPQGQPAWGAPQGQQPAQQPQGQPSWQPPATGGAPMQPAPQQQPTQGGQPAWSQQPPNGGAPAWGNR